MARFTTRVRPIQQMEAAECGVACLAMLLDYHGSYRPLDEVRVACGTSRDGNSAWDLLSGARRLGLEGEGLGLSLEELGAVALPAILHWDMSHFVVLERYAAGRVRIVDPANGRRWVESAELDRSFSGVALELRPTADLPKRRRRSPSYARYVQLLLAERSALAFVIISSVLMRVLAACYPAATQVILDHVVQGQRRHWLLGVLGVLCGATLMQLLLMRLHGHAQAALHVRLEVSLSRALGQHLLKLPLPFLESRSHGDMLERVRAQSELKSLLSRTADATFDLLFIVLLGTLLFAYDAALGAISVGLTLTRLVLIRLAREPSEQRAAAELAARGREQATLVEATACPEMIKGLGSERTLTERYLRRVAERAFWSESSARLEQGVGQVAAALGGLQQAVILWFGGRQVIDGRLTIGVFVGFLAVRALLEAPLQGLLEAMEGWLRFRGVLDRCDDVLGVPVEPAGQLPVSKLRGRLQLLNVGFRYGTGGDWVFRHVNVNIEPGEHIALFGPSGQGKSTLGKLMVGLLRPTEGQVLLDGIEVACFRAHELARRVGVVPQEPYAAPAPLFDALRVRLPEATSAQIDEAVRLACFGEVVSKMPAGYATLLSAHAENLSGGERQRLALAQALLGAPDLLLMDEATSALDAATEQRLLGHLQGLSATRISIAHRKSVVDCAGRALLVSGGQVWERNPGEQEVA